MSLTPWKPFFESFDDIEKYFGEDFSLMDLRRGDGFIPAIDVYTEKNNLVVEVPLAGIDPKDVEVTIENNVLTIKGKSEKKTEVDEKNYYRKEMRHGSFYRSIALPEAVEGDEAKAEAENGMLKVMLPKAKKSVVKGTSVPIKNLEAEKKPAKKKSSKK